MANLPTLQCSSHSPRLTFQHLTRTRHPLESGLHPFGWRGWLQCLLLIVPILGFTGRPCCCMSKNHPAIILKSEQFWASEIKSWINNHMSLLGISNDMSFCNPSNYCNDWCVHPQNERENDTKPPLKGKQHSQWTDNSTAAWQRQHKRNNNRDCGLIRSRFET